MPLCPYSWFNLTDNASGQLSAAMDATQTTFALNAGQGARFPSSDFVLNIEDERLYVATRSGDSFSGVVRGFDGSAGGAHPANAWVQLSASRALFQRIYDNIIGHQHDAGNGNTANVVANASDTYLAGSALSVGGRLQAGTVFRWRFSMTKTAAGTGAPVYSVRFGTNGSTADTARCTFTGPSQTAATDTGWHEITAVVRSVSATGAVQGVCTLEHMNTTTGLQNVAQIRVLQSLSGAFNNSGATLIAGVSVNPGSSAVWTYQLVSAEAVNLI